MMSDVSPTLSNRFKLAYYTSQEPTPTGDAKPFDLDLDEEVMWVDSLGQADAVIALSEELNAARELTPNGLLVGLHSSLERAWPPLADEVIERGADRVERDRLWRRLKRLRSLQQTRRELTASERRVEALKVASQALSELHDEREILAQLVEVVAEQLRSERVSVLQVFAERGELQMIAARGIPPEVIERARPKIGEGIAGRCAQLAQPIFVSNHQRYRDHSGGEVTRSEVFNDQGEAPMSLTVPLLVKGEVVGVVNVTGRADNRPYSSAEIAFLSALMSHAGYLMESTQLIERLQALRAFSEQVINTLTDPLAVVSCAGALLKANPRFVEVFGSISSSADASEISDLKDHLAEALTPELDQELQSHLERRSDFSFTNLRYAGRTFDGRLIPFEGDDLRMLLILHDVTERQNMGKQLLSAEKMASLGILAAGVAHEINNPLGFVKTNTKEAGRYFEDLFEVIDAWEKYASAQSLTGVTPLRVASDLGLDEVREDVPNLVRESLEGIERIQKITASLKSFAHPDTENTREAQLSTLVENALVITQSKWRHTLTISREIPEHGPLACIPSQLEQVFMNLVVNAAQAAQSRGESAKMEITLSAPPAEGDSEVTICFADQCGGIPEEVVERIFDPFFTTKDIGEGTGLGLHIAHNIIEGHGGRIEVDSQPPEGTTFRISLPLGVKRGPLVIKQLSRFKA